MAAENEYFRGQRVGASALVTNALGTGMDASTVLFTVKQGDSGTVATYALAGGSVVRDGTGMYHVELDTSLAAGEWAGYWTATGGVQAAAQRFFMVRERPF